MRVFKFGGASVRNADSIKKVATIIKSYTDQPLLVVVSAMGKTTNALENLIKLKDFEEDLNQILTYHSTIIEALFEGKNPLVKELESVRLNITEQLKISHSSNDKLYDQVVSQGEILSTLIVGTYLKEIRLPVLWQDARNYITTNGTFREAIVDWDKSNDLIKPLIKDLNTHIIVTQGFIGSCNGITTTLGREGSDFSAAIFASCLSAESVTIWKDVPGVMSADPKRLPNPTTFDELPFREAAEMTYYGASVIHPKTIKPLANRNIPLLICQEQ